MKRSTVTGRSGRSRTTGTRNYRSASGSGSRSGASRRSPNEADEARYGDELGMFDDPDRELEDGEFEADFEGDVGEDGYDGYGDEADQDDDDGQSDGAPGDLAVALADDDEPVVCQAGGSPASAAAMALGGLLVVAGAGAIALWAASQSMRDAMLGVGIAPMQLLTCGLVLGGLGWLARGVAHLREQAWALANHAEQQRSRTARTDAQLAYLIQSDSTRPDAAPETGDSAASAVQQAIHLIQRQEEKINNLSKATKMYGKPLLEITSQLSDASRQVAEMSSTVNALKIIVEQSSSRLENAVRAASGADLDEALRQSQHATRSLENMQRELSDRLLERSDKMVEQVKGASELSQQTVAELKQELAKSLSSTAELKQELTKSLSSTAERFASELAELDRNVEQTKSALIKAIQSMPTESDGGGAPQIDGALRSIHDELGALSRSVAELSRAAPAAPAAAAAAGGPGEGAGEGAGEGKKVMSAIAKLKQLRQ